MDTGIFIVFIVPFFFFIVAGINIYSDLLERSIYPIPNIVFLLMTLFIIAIEWGIKDSLIIFGITIIYGIITTVIFFIVKIGAGDAEIMYTSLPFEIIFTCTIKGWTLTNPMMSESIINIILLQFFLAVLFAFIYIVIKNIFSKLFFVVKSFFNKSTAKNNDCKTPPSPLAFAVFIYISKIIILSLQVL